MDSDVTQMLAKIEIGDPAAAQQLLPLVYDELRKLAAARLSKEQPGQTLQATALVHEAYLRLVAADEQSPEWGNRGHFFAAAAEAMRRILVENARRKKRTRHGGELERVDFQGLELVGLEPREDLVALDSALGQLKKIDPTAADVVQLRYFAGLTLVEVAQTLRISPRSADRAWVYAKAWLHRQLLHELELD